MTGITNESFYIGTNEVNDSKLYSDRGRHESAFNIYSPEQIHSFKTGSIQVFANQNTSLSMDVDEAPTTEHIALSLQETDTVTHGNSEDKTVNNDNSQPDMVDNNKVAEIPPMIFSSDLTGAKALQVLYGCNNSRQAPVKQIKQLHKEYKNGDQSSLTTSTNLQGIQTQSILSKEMSDEQKQIVPQSEEKVDSEAKNVTQRCIVESSGTEVATPPQVKEQGPSTPKSIVLVESKINEKTEREHTAEVKSQTVATEAPVEARELVEVNVTNKKPKVAMPSQIKEQGPATPKSIVVLMESKINEKTEREHTAEVRSQTVATEARLEALEPIIINVTNKKPKVATPSQIKEQGPATPKSIVARVESKINEKTEREHTAEVKSRAVAAEAPVEALEPVEVNETNKTLEVCELNDKSSTTRDCKSLPSQSRIVKELVTLKGPHRLAHTKKSKGMFLRSQHKTDTTTTRHSKNEGDNVLKATDDIVKKQAECDSTKTNNTRPWRKLINRQFLKSKPKMKSTHQIVQKSAIQSSEDKTHAEVTHDSEMSARSFNQNVKHTPLWKRRQEHTTTSARENEGDMQNDRNPKLPERGYLEDIDFVVNEFDMILRKNPDLPDRNYLEDIDFVSQEFDLFFRRKSKPNDDQDEQEEESNTDTAMQETESCNGDKEDINFSTFQDTQQNTQSEACVPTVVSSESSNHYQPLTFNKEDGKLVQDTRLPPREGDYQPLLFRPMGTLNTATSSNSTDEERNINKDEAALPDLDANTEANAYQPLLFTNREKHPHRVDVYLDSSHLKLCSSAKVPSAEGDYQPLIFEMKNSSGEVCKDPLNSTVSHSPTVPSGEGNYQPLVFGRETTSVEDDYMPVQPFLGSPEKARSRYGAQEISRKVQIGSGASACFPDKLSTSSVKHSSSPGKNLLPASQP